MKVAVIGGAGKAGHYVTEWLADACSVRALARSDASANLLESRYGVEVARADLDQPATVESALKDIERLILISPYDPRLSEREIAAIDAAEAAGVDRVVKISSYSAGLLPEVEVSRRHKASERRLRESELRWSILRPDWWLDNFLMQAAHISAGRFSLPASGARVTAIDARDVAAVAVAESLAEHPYGGVLNLTGPEILDFTDIAQRLSAALGRSVEFRDDVPSIWSDDYAEAMRGLFHHYRGRRHPPFTNTVEEIVGRTPHTLEEFAREVLLPALA